MEEKKISYRGRRLARLAAVQALFQYDQTQASVPSIVLEFLQHRFDNSGVEGLSLKKADTPFFAEVVHGVGENVTSIDEMIAASLTTGWSLERIAPLLKAVLRAGIYELRSVLAVPTAVIINEYVEVARAFLEEKDVAFVNKTLDHLAKTVRQGTPPHEAAQ